MVGKKTIMKMKRPVIMQEVDGTVFLLTERFHLQEPDILSLLPLTLKEKRELLVLT